jgi:hypothetical protein
MAKWKCKSCLFVGEGDNTMQGHSMSHLYADTLLVEVLNERSMTEYPIQYVRVNA